MDSSDSALVGLFAIQVIISLILTALLYGAGPILLLIFHKQPIDLKKLKLFHIIYTVLISFSLNIYYSTHGYKMNFSPALLWGFIFYGINKAQFEKRQSPPTSTVRVDDAGQAKEFVVDESTGEVLSEKTIEAPAPIVPDKDPDPVVHPVKKPEPDVCPVKEPGPKQNKPHEFKALCVILAIICVASLAGNGLQAYWNVSQQKTYQVEQTALEKELSEQKKLVSNLQDVRSDLMSENNELKEKNTRLLKSANEIFPEYFFYVSHIGLIVDGSKYYHSYDCEIYKNSDEFWAHNVEYCEYLGYSPCPVCLGDN